MEKIKNKTKNDVVAVWCDNCRREKAVGINEKNLSVNLCVKCNYIYAQYEKTKNALFKI